MLEPVRTKAERQRQGEESGNRVPTSTKNRQRAGRGGAGAATGRAAQDLGRREAATLTKWARWNRRQYLTNDIFGMLRIHRFPGASTARGRTGPRELFSSRQYPHLHILFAHSHRAEIEGSPRGTAQEHFAVSAEIVGTPEKFDITRAGKDSVYSEAQT